MLDERLHDSGESPPRAYRGRQPRLPMEALDLVHLLDVLEEAGVGAWVDGGWGVDALLGEQTREHDDVDLVVELADVPRLIAALAAEGHELVVGAPPGNFVLVDAAGRQVDVHPVAFDENGGGVYLMDNGRTWTYPAEGFAGRGRVAERPVRCLTAAVQVLVHDGYELTDKDYRELRLLHERFGVELPPAVRERALATGDHGKLYPSGMPRSSQYRARGRRNALDVNLHDELIARLQYFDGHSDTIGLFADAAFLARAAAAVAEPFAEAGVQKVAGIEARGFVLATAVALELGAGFVAVRKPGAIHPGPKAELTAPPDWRGIETVLRVQRHAIATGDGVLLVDDWAETGSKALTAHRLIDACGGRYLGLSLLVDQLPSKLRDELAPVAAVALAEELRE